MFLKVRTWQDLLFRASTIDFFPSLLKEKKFIDTVENLTIFIEKKNENGEMFNIILKDQIDGVVVLKLFMLKKDILDNFW